MFLNLLHKVFGSSNERFLKRLRPIVAHINTFETTLENLSDEALGAKTTEFKQRLAQGESLDDLLPEAFAVVREAAKRVLGLRPYDVQMLGGLVLHKGMGAEMATGEGKTLVATLPVYLNALTGKGVHVVTVNDYLVQRDAEEMGKIYRFLGLTVGCVINTMDDEERQQAYNCDITYATNNELGFDYLRDNMKFRREEMVQRDFHYAIVDEVDSILIDEARTPLIISGPSEDSSELYQAVNQIIPKLNPEDYEKEEKSKSLTLTEVGNQHVEELLDKAGLLKNGGLYEIQNIGLVHHVNQALRAHQMFQRDVDYIVKDDKIIIIDEFTGRMMEGRRFSDGLHQALEAKEGVTIQMENQTLASITFQNYFRMYDKLAGMTGTAVTEAAELADIYNMEVVQIPTHVPIARKDYDDEVYRTEREKIDAIIKLIKECQDRRQPVLVGTTSIEKSERLSASLKQSGVNHSVLNARYHQSEAGIIAQAGRPGRVTIATNMAGRGTDIKLGGNVEMRLAAEMHDISDPQERQRIEDKIRAEVAEAANVVKEAGGLYVIGTERHESRRIDNQLRGRAGRQGDPGASKFFLSLEDDLMRIFGSDRLDAMLQRLGLEEGEAITHPWVNKALERAQQKVEARNYDIRKHLLKYDDVMNDQRKVVYTQRRDVMEKDDMSAFIAEMRQEAIDNLVDFAIPENAFVDQWDLKALHEECLRLLGVDLPIQAWAEEDGMTEAEMRERVHLAHQAHMAKKEQQYTPALMRIAEKSILLRVLDSSWKDHLHALDHLRQGINLRAYAQRDPLNEYKQEAFVLFEDLLNRVRETAISLLSHLTIGVENEQELEEAAFSNVDAGREDYQYSGPDHGEGDGKGESVGATKSITDRLARGKKGKKPAAGAERVSTAVAAESEAEPLSRNALCSCGSGKRFKHCCGKVK
jgi:protein translocase subunit secA